MGSYRCFKVFEPKERQFRASAFSEQLLQHALMNGCHERFGQAQIFDRYAGRKGCLVYQRRNFWVSTGDGRRFFYVWDKFQAMKGQPC